MNRTTNWMLLGVAMTVLSAIGARAGTARYGGGSYDGYDRIVMQRTLGFPAVNNANGATNVLSTSACLNGMLVDTGVAATAVSVYWGPGDGVTNKAVWLHQCDFGVCAAGQALATNVIGLTQNTPYFYRFYATNAASNDAWADTTSLFVTPGFPAITTASGATLIGPRTATLNGNLTAGGSATVTIYWGQNSNNWAGSATIGTAVQGVPCSTAVSGLNVEGALYYYQCYASNAYGSAWSTIAAFTTTLATARYGGSSYDGYDRMAVRATMQALKGSTVVLFR